MTDAWTRAIGIRSLAARSLFVPSVIVSFAALEAILWEISGRGSDPTQLAAIASLTTGTAILSWIGVWLLRGVVRAASAQTTLLAIAVLPYTLHVGSKLELRIFDFLPSTLFVAMILALGIASIAARLSRFSPLRATVTIFAVAACLTLAWLQTGGDERPARAGRGTYPDVVLIVMDTTRRDHLSLYGYEKQTTPELEAFAKQAQVYEDAWSTAPWTPSSHASMFTGRLPAEHGVDGVQLPAFPLDLPSLPEILESAGFHTAGFVANPNLLGPGWDRGFERYQPAWFDGPHSLGPLLNWILMRGVPVWLDDASSDRVLRNARSWWARNADAPRFLFLNLIDPHDPYRPPEAERSRFLPALSRAESFAFEQDPQHYARHPGVDASTLRVITALYDAEIAALDRRLGTFFHWLNDRGELDESLIIVTADHGERLGERGMLGHLLKMDQHLLRVPLVVRAPSLVDPMKIKERVQLHGIPGEILALIGIDAERVQRERRLSNQVDEAQGPLESPPVAYAQHRYFGWYVGQLRATDADFDDSMDRGNWSLVADDEHVLLWSPDRPEQAGQMVALHGDPNWTVNLWGTEPEKRKTLLQLAAGLPSFSDTADPSQDEETAIEIDDTLRQRLRALGYSE